MNVYIEEVGLIWFGGQMAGVYAHLTATLAEWN